ncbi:MAG: hypothetical protein R2799_12925 [Crocinitomicaceae bacterium]
MNSIWIIVGVLFIGALLWFGLGGGFGREEFNQENTDWDYSNGFDPTDKNPYGTFVLKELMDSGIAQIKLKMIQTRMDLDELRGEKNAIYLFIGHQSYMSDGNVDKLLEFVAQGNTAYISTQSIPIYLEHALFEDYIYTNGFYSGEKPTPIKIKNQEIHSIPFINENDTVDFYWNHFEEGDFFETYDMLGSVDGKTDFIRIRYGEGYFFLHLNPYVHTNVSILQEEGLLLTEEIFSQLPKGDVYWDVYSSNFHNQDYYEKRSVLEFILNNESLRWAFLILLIGVLIFGTFASKRYFSIIPVVKQNQNTSLEFVETISKLYRNQGDNADLIKIKLQNFKNFISHYYFLDSKKLDEEFKFKLAQKSNISEERIETLIKKLEFGASNDSISNEYLIDTHKKLEEFYSNCKGARRHHEKIPGVKEVDIKLMRGGKMPLSIIIAGALVLFLGIVFLTLGAGIGTLFILFGLFTAIFGYVLFSTPLIVVREGELSYQKWIDRKQFNLLQLQTSKYEKGNEIFELTSNNAQMKIDMRDLSAKDQQILVQTIRNIKLK